MEDTEIGGPQRRFRTTLWSVVLTAKNPESPDRRDALERLIRAYWKPVYSFLRGRGYPVDQSKDVTQGFFAAFLEKDFLQYVTQGRGKFRTFLLIALNHYLADEYDRATAQKRGGGQHILSLDFAQAETDVSMEPVVRSSPDDIFRREWAVLVIGRALQALKTEFQSAGRDAEFDVLRLNLGFEAALSYEEVARKLGISISDVKNRLHRARLRLREAILEEIRTYTENEQEAEEELRDLFVAFS